MGTLAAVIVIFAVGLLMRAWIFRKMMTLGEFAILGIPVVITGVGFGGSAISGFGSTARCRRKLGR